MRLKRSYGLFSSGTGGKADGGRYKMVVAETMKNKELADLSFFETTGFSMWPFLRAGEKLLIKKTPTEKLKVGDIIIYRADNQLVCHRLIKKIKERERYLLYVRGDSSVSSPEPITEEMFLGKATGIIKNGNLSIDLLFWLLLWLVGKLRLLKYCSERNE